MMQAYNQTDYRPHIFGGVILALASCFMLANLALWVAIVLHVVIGAGFIAVIVFKAWTWVQGTRLDFFRSWTAARFQVHPGGGLVGDMETGHFQYYGRGRRDPVPVPDVQQVEQVEPTPELLPMVRDCRRLAVFGGSGAGKSTLALHLAAHKLSQGGSVIVCDPKPEGDLQWPGACQVCGHGYEYGEIREMFDRINAEFMHRKETFKRQGGQFQTLFIILDEVNLCVDNIPGFADQYRRILQEGRSYSIDLCILGQSKRAKSLGLDGRYDVMESFEMLVGMKRNVRTKVHSATVEMLDEDPLPVIPPGPFQGVSCTSTGHVRTPIFSGTRAQGTQGTRYTPGAEIIDLQGVKDRTGHVKQKVHGVHGTRPVQGAVQNPVHAKIIEMHRQKKSMNQIAGAVFGSTGGKQNQKIKTILRQYKIA